MLIDDGLVARDRRTVASPDRRSSRPSTVPPSIQALLAARLERLSPEERTVLEAAAVVGKDFFVGAVRDLVPEEARARVPADLMGARAQGADPCRSARPSLARTRSGSGTC